MDSMLDQIKEYFKNSKDEDYLLNVTNNIPPEYIEVL